VSDLSLAAIKGDVEEIQARVREHAAIVNEIDEVALLSKLINVKRNSSNCIQIVVLY
jgi:hypothetical protein